MSSRRWRALAFVHFRGDYFRNELISALIILDDGEIEPRHMVGSWAGAMGQTQFMPSSFLIYAVDFEGNGRRDIWTQRARRHWLDRQFSRRARVDEGHTVGLRGSVAGRFLVDERRLF